MSITLAFEIIPKKNLTSLCVVLHGYGADGHDLVDIGQHYAPFLPNTGFLFPHAIEACEVTTHGRQWFGLGDFDPHTVRGGLDRAGPILSDFIKKQALRFQLSVEKDVILMGFSQGTIMSLDMLYYFPKLKGIMGFSGAYYPRFPLTQFDQKTPIALAHGAMDPVVPYGALQIAKDTLVKQNQTPPITHTSPFSGHGIDEDALNFGKKWLQSVL